MNTQVDWEAIRKGQVLYESGCWTTCGGGFCCSNNHPDFNFQLLPMGGTTLLYMEEEYQYLVQSGAVLDTAPQYLELDFGGPRPLRVVHVTCKLLGACDGVIDKPLLCKLYPYLPVLDTEGVLTEILPASIFDLTFEMAGQNLPCTVAAKRRHYQERWTSHPQELDILRHPYVLLYVQAAKHFIDSYTKELSANKKLASKKGKDFWKSWEMEYLSGRLVNLAEVQGNVYNSYRKLEARYGSFWDRKELNR